MTETAIGSGPAKKGLIGEDWLSLILGLVIFTISLGAFQDTHFLGWGAKLSVWIEPLKALKPLSAHFAEMSPFVSLICTFAFALVLMTLGAIALGANVPRFILGFTLIFWIAYACYFLGNYAVFAANGVQAKKLGIDWSMGLSGDFGYILALIVGLCISNFLPKLAATMREAARPELFIKTGIVIMGAGLGIKAAQSFGLATNIMFRGFCAIIEAYLIYWALVYYISRKYFHFSREWAAPLASGISICGVSAAIATGGAIRARPIVPIMVSSLVVIFVAIEMIFLPILAKFALWQEPMVAGAWMGLAVKSDGGAIASGAITESMILAQAADAGINYAEGWIAMTATTVKMFIDIFIGVWAFLLAYIWTAKIDVRPGQKVSASEIWNRFPKFVIGYALTFAIMIVLCWSAATTSGKADITIREATAEVSSLENQVKAAPESTQLQNKLAEAQAHLKALEDGVADAKGTLKKAGMVSSQGDVFRGLFFLLCFFAIGLVSNFKKLREEGIGKLALVYVVSLFGFILWIGLFISWLFFHGVKPPTV